MEDIGVFIKKRRKEVKVETISDKINKLPWYRKPLNRVDFITRKGKDNKYYVHHNEWSKVIWIGPYDSTIDTESIIDSYLEESSKAPLDRKVNDKIHSIHIENYEEFFKKS